MKPPSPTPTGATRRRPSRRVVTSLLALAGTGLFGVRPARASSSLRPTPRDFEGPYRPPAGTAWGGQDLMVDGVASPGTPLRLVGRVLDTSGQPLAGARLHVWQANSTGRYNHPNEDEGHGVPDPGFRGYGSMVTDGAGCFAFRTILPAGYRRVLFGFVPWRFVPHIHVEVHAPQKLLTTQINVEPERARQRDAGPGPEQAAVLASAAFAPLRGEPGEVLRFDVVVDRG
jgi:protocatechuate 3,4-dioxygenase, beta subunit